MILHYHPLSSFCHKALIALDEKGVAFTPHLVDLSDEAQAAALRALWPMRKFPVLEHDGRIVPETSTIVDYLDVLGGAPLVPADPDAMIETRLLDRIFDNYVHLPMQKLMLDLLKPAGMKGPAGVEEAGRTIRTAYGLLEARLAGRSWAAGEAFTLADCAAAPSLFYARVAVPLDGHPTLAAYFERLVARPSVARVLDEARPWFRMFPMVDRLEARFR